ncbi:MAG: HEAT repeat domain-containing protein, partial [Chloroflexi bacterium]|nr:HEAT repeat domain-containing protein [Chloroflexota bacterium]
MAIADYLEEIAELERPLGIAKLVQLSGLEGGDIETLREVWPTIPEERRSEVVDALVQLGEDNVELNFDEVFRACLNDEDSRVRVKAIDGLWESEDKSFIDAFIQLMRYDEEPDVRSTAAIALGRFALMAEMDELKPANVEKVKGALLEKVNDDDESSDVRRRAVESVGFFSEDGVQDVVRRYYETGDEKMKASAVCAMGHSCDPTWLPVLIIELQNPDPEI